MGAQPAVEEPLALLERHGEQRLAVEVEQVEGLVHDLGRFTAPLAAGDAPGADAGVVLEEAEPGAALLVERDDLTADDRLGCVDPAAGPGQVGEVRRGVLVSAGPQADLAVADNGLNTVAVPLDFEEPVRIAERPRRQGRAHGRDEVRHARVARRRQVDLSRRPRWVRRETRRNALADLVVRASGLDAGRVLLRVPTIDGCLVLLLEQQPAFAAIRVIGPDDGVAAVEPLAVEDELDLALAQSGARRGLVRLGLPGAPVPDDDVPGAVLLLRDDALERQVLDRVVLGAHRQPSHLGVQGRALGNGPADEHAVDLEPEVVVQRRRAVSLHGEATAALDDLARCRLRGPGEVALAPILLQRHLGLPRQLELVEGADDDLRPGLAQRVGPYGRAGGYADRRHSGGHGRAHVPRRVAHAPGRLRDASQQLRGAQQQVGCRLGVPDRATVDDPRLVRQPQGHDGGRDLLGSRGGGDGPGDAG